MSNSMGNIEICVKNPDAAQLQIVVEELLIVVDAGRLRFAELVIRAARYGTGLEPKDVAWLIHQKVFDLDFAQRIVQVERGQAKLTRSFRISTPTGGIELEFVPGEPQGELTLRVLHGASSKDTLSEEEMRKILAALAGGAPTPDLAMIEPAHATSRQGDLTLVYTIPAERPDAAKTFVVTRPTAQVPA